MDASKEGDEPGQECVTEDADAPGDAVSVGGIDARVHRCRNREGEEEEPDDETDPPEGERKGLGARGRPALPAAVLRATSPSVAPEAGG